jgi:hypothetical protein
VHSARCYLKNILPHAKAIANAIENEDLSMLTVKGGNGHKQSDLTPDEGYLLEMDEKTGAIDRKDTEFGQIN